MYSLMGTAVADVFVGAIVTRFRSYRRGIVGAIANRLKSSTVMGAIVAVVMIIHVVCLSICMRDGDEDGVVVVGVVVVDGD